MISHLGHSRFAFATYLLAGSFAAAQIAPPTPTPAARSNADGVPTVTLSPFEVRTDKDEGYVASTSLAGTRLNTELWDTPAAISVMTKEFMEDTGVLNVNAALDYAMNVSNDHTDYTGQSIAYNDINIQMRGFVGAQVGRNFFSSSLSGDRFNTERIDFSRGPNSVLFGLGSPGASSTRPPSAAGSTSASTTCGCVTAASTTGVRRSISTARCYATSSPCA